MCCQAAKQYTHLQQLLFKVYMNNPKKENFQLRQY
jgi:hypothetical protein